MPEPGPPGAPPPTCDECGRGADDLADLLGWSTTVEAGRRHRVCVDCSRTHLRSLEARLDRAWW